MPSPIRRRRQKVEMEPIIHRICHLFFNEKRTASEIAEQLAEEMEEHVSREQIYPLLQRGRDIGIVRLVPKLEEGFHQELAAKFPLLAKDGVSSDTIRVVSTSGPATGGYFASAAAAFVMELLMKLYTEMRRPIRLGLGPGRATLDLARSLGEMMRSDVRAPKLRLHAITAGAPDDHPEYTPVAYFHLFPEHCVERCVGLFAETLVTARQYKQLAATKNLIGFSEAYAMREEVDVVVTSMGDIQHKHDLFRRFLLSAGEEEQAFIKRGYVGNVQYRPYTATGPVKEKPNEKRAVTLFELDDFVRMSELRNKHVVLLARSCPECGRSRAAALRPLLECKDLKVWSKLVLDADVAHDLLSQPEPNGNMTGE